MELFGMPRVDKPATYPEHMQYDSATAPLRRSPVNKFGSVSGDILSSTAWSALIHRPADDSEPDELPSTVDMDAIKEPLTPMPPPVLTPKPEPPDPSADDSSSNSDSEADSSSSGGGSNTDSDEGSNSGSCSWSNSGSDCGDRAPPADSKARSSCSSRSSDQRSDSDHSTPQNKLFAIKNMEQGGLKFKLSAVEKKKSPPPKEESSSSSSSDERDNSSSDEEADKSSDASQSPTLPRKHITETQPSKPHKEEMPVVKVAKESPVKEEEKKKRVPAPTVEEKKEHFTKPTKVLPDEKQVKPAMTKLVKEETRSSTRLAQIANLRAEIKSVSKSPTKTNNRSNESIKTSRSIKTTVSSKSLEKISPPPATSTGRLRSVRRIPRPLAVQEKTPTKVISGADSCDSDDEDDEEADGRGREGGEITNIAQQLGDSEPHSNIAISEQLQVINQEDLAAILPDVVGVFDGFEDVSGGEGRGAAGGSKAGAARGAPGPGQESSSDMELLPEQEQIVSEAIKRIELDSEGGTTEQQPRPSSASGPDDDDNEEVGYSSSLLQQFVEKTEQLSKGQKGTAAGSSEAAPRRRRGRPPKPSAAPAQLPANDLHNNNRLVMPELEAYMRLDCSVSNVSPDSGIQSVAGSPSHQCSPAWHPPAHSPAPHHNPAPHHDHPSPGTSVPDKHTEKISKLYATTADILGELAGKRGPGRPKGSGRRKRRRLMINSELLLNKEGLKHARDVLKVPPFYRHPNQKTVVNMVESNDELPRLPGMIPGKRGPGRPKKTPPTLEPMLPLSSSKGKKSLGKGKEKGDDRFLFGKQDAAIKSSGSFLNDICERVSKRLDIPLSLARLPKSLSEKCGSPGPKSLEAKSVSRTKLGASLEKRKKGRRKMLMQSRSLALPKGLLKVRQHKHKKRKKMKKTIKNLDQRFIMDLERLVQDFNMMCCINPEAPVKASENPVLPQIFRLKRIVKKRKGSERDRDSGPEVEPSKDKTPTHISLANAAPAVVKRRPKKNNTVETTKNRDRPEANNEQRLPLKKRHYPCEDIPLASTPAIPANEPETTVSSENPQEQAKTLNAKSVIMSVVDKISEKVQQSSGGKNGPSGAKLAPVTAGGKPVTLSKPESKSKVEIHRNSIDEAIEATITRFSHESRSVIVTPKKRHRLEMDKKGSATSPVVRNLSGNKGEGSVGSPQPSKRVVSRSSSTNNQGATRTVSLSPTPQQAKRSSSRGTSKQAVPSGPRQRSGSRGSSETAVTVISGYMQPASNRISTRSSDITITTASNKRVSKLGATEKTEENKPLNTGNVTSATQAVLNKRATREKSYSGAAIEVKTAIIPTQEATKPVHQNTSFLNTRSAIKIPPDAPLITPIPPTPENINSKSSRSRSNKPPAGVFEPSSNADELMSLVSIPPTHVNNMDTVLSQLSEKLKGFESTNTLPAPILKLDESHNGRNRPKRLSDSSGDDEKKLKKRKVIRDIRVHVQKLSPSDLVLKKVMGVVKTKIRRRNRFNRTGFPVKKKKKKKLIIEEVLSTSLVESKIVPINEKEKPKVPVITSILDLPSPVICVKKIDDIIVKEEDKVDKLKTEVMVEIFKEELRNVKSNEEVKDLKLKEVKEEKTVFEKQIMEKQDSPEEFTPLSQRVKRTDEPKMNTRLVKRHENHKAESKTNNKTERTLVGGKSEQAKVELRKSSRRLMMIKARQRVEASMRRKRKLSLTSVDEIIPREKRSPSPELPPPPLIEGNSSESRLLATKRLRRPREDLEKDDSDADSTRSRKKPPPRWRKKYLTAGLFSDCFKEDEPRKSAEVCKSRLVYNPEEHRHGLLPPPYYCGKWVRQRKIHFQLPHDLWWLHTNSQLPGRDIVPSWNYKKIRTNVYYDLKPNLVYEAQACSCKVEGDSGCGDDCINRMIYTECSSEQCPCSDKCCNQRIMRHEWAPGLDKFMTKDKGWGVKTKYAIKSGEFILEYVGEVVSDKEFKNRMASRYQHDTHHYCLNLDGGLVIDGHRMGGDGRFVNHSCEPNCEIQKWSVNGLYRMALFALRDIQPHEELTYDYNFSLFNPAEGQKCKCGSKNCRGVIGGKSQRVSLTNPPSGSGGAVGIDEKMQRKPRKARKSAESRKKEAQSKETVTTTVTPVAPVRENKEWSQEAIVARLNHLLPLKPLTPQHRAFVLQSRPFLLRNLEKVSQLREKLKQLVRSTAVSAPEPPAPAPAPLPQPQVKESEVFLTQLNALSTPRNIRTRRLAQAQDNPEMTRTAKLAHAFKLLYNAVAQAKEEDGELLATPLVNLPSKRKLPQYFQRVTEPIDLTTIEHNIVTGVYKTVDMFDQDMTRLFSNNVRFYGRTSDIGIAATRLRKEYGIAKLEHVDQLREILGDEILPPNFLPEQEDPGAEEEDVIRCICGMFRDEGLMIQCERCLVWQHTDCVKADTNVDKYLCERCSPREVDYEIPLEVTPEYASDGQKHFMTLLRGDLQLRQGDTVYVLRDIPNEETGSETTPLTKHNYKTIKNFKYSDCDIFRIERLWKDEKGQRFAFGHHYLRPHETFHEPTRKFFPNELMRIPLYEVVPLDLIMGHCYVLDINTFCKGRPVGADPNHIYICEYRVDKGARLFAKLAKSKTPPVCLKNYAFDKFDQRLKITRTYTPHGTVKGGSVSRGRGGRSAHDSEESSAPPPPPSEDEELPLARVRDTALASKRVQQKAALNVLLLRLLARLPSKQPLDVSYLLEPGRRHRKRPAILSP